MKNFTFFLVIVLMILFSETSMAQDEGSCNGVSISYTEMEKAKYGNGQCLILWIDNKTDFGQYVTVKYELKWEWTDQNYARQEDSDEGELTTYRMAHGLKSYKYTSAFMIPDGSTVKVKTEVISCRAVN